MRSLGLLTLLLLFAAPATAVAQESVPTERPIIESAEVTGLPFDQLSPGLQRDIDALAGARLNREEIAALSARIESEHPDVVAATRDVVRPDGRVRVIFLVARISDDTTLASNINGRYTVERVELSGIDDERISQPLRDELQKLVGGRFDSDLADALADKLEAEQPDYDVGRRVTRGDASGALRVVFTFRRSEARRWLHFAPSRTKLVYQGDLGWSGVWDIQLGGPRDSQLSLGLVRGNNDDLVEEYSGYWLRAENREAGTKRLGVSLEFSSLRQMWEPATLDALESAPSFLGAYRTRRTVQPAVTFAFTPRVRISAGVSASELRPLDESADSQRANAGVFSVGYDQAWRPDDRRSRRGRNGDDDDKDWRRWAHRVEANYQFRAGTTALDSDLVYKRHLGQARYRFERGNSALIAGISFGRITGQAPLFERFTLGDTATLRGWNKYVVAPAGGDRMFHQSLEFRYGALAYFLDAGSVWQAGTERELRFSTGVGLHGDNFFLTFGVPLNGDDVDPTFMLGVRF